MIVTFPRHKLHRCPSTCEGCCICEGGLALCVTCGGAEASLPTHCPQRRMAGVEQDAVQAGVLDYDLRRGGWVRVGGALTGRLPPWPGPVNRP